MMMMMLFFISFYYSYNLLLWEDVSSLTKLQMKKEKKTNVSKRETREIPSLAVVKRTVRSLLKKRSISLSYVRVGVVLFGGVVEVQQAKK